VTTEVEKLVELARVEVAPAFLHTWELLPCAGGQIELFTLPKLWVMITA
jgi:hypothetical protein